MGGTEVDGCISYGAQKSEVEELRASEVEEHRIWVAQKLRNTEFEGACQLSFYWLTRIIALRLTDDNLSIYLLTYFKFKLISCLISCVQLINFYSSWRISVPFVF